MGLSLAPLVSTIKSCVCRHFTQYSDPEASHDAVAQAVILERLREDVPQLLVRGRSILTYELSESVITTYKNMVSNLTLHSDLEHLDRACKD